MSSEGTGNEAAEEPKPHGGPRKNAGPSTLAQRLAKAPKQANQPSVASLFARPARPASAPERITAPEVVVEGGGEPRDGANVGASASADQRSAERNREPTPVDTPAPIQVENEAQLRPPPKAPMPQPPSRTATPQPTADQWLRAEQLHVADEDLVEFDSDGGGGGGGDSDDDGGDEDSGDDAESEESDGEGNRGPGRAKKGFRYTGDAAKFIQASLDTVMESRTYIKPLKAYLYTVLADGQLWFHPPDPTVTLSSPGAEGYSIPSLFVWSPKDIGGEIQCPQCGSSKCEMNKWSEPRRVVDVDRCYALVGVRYKCLDCEERVILARRERKAREAREDLEHPSRQPRVRPRKRDPEDVCCACVCLHL